MPSHVSAEKRVRKTARRTTVNKNRKSQIRTAVRKVEEALSSGNRDAAAAALKAAEPQIMRGGCPKALSTGIPAHAEVSRLTARLKKAQVLIRDAATLGSRDDFPEFQPLSKSERRAFAPARNTREPARAAGQIESFLCAKLSHANKAGTFQFVSKLKKVHRTVTDGSDFPCRHSGSIV